MCKHYNPSVSEGLDRLDTMKKVGVLFAARRLPTVFEPAVRVTAVIFTLGHPSGPDCFRRTHLRLPSGGITSKIISRIPFTPHENSHNCHQLYNLSEKLAFPKPVPTIPSVIMVPREIIMLAKDGRISPWGRSPTCPVAPAKPRKNARLKTDNPFPINKTTPKSRAFMRGFQQKLALLRTPPRWSTIWLCLAFYLRHPPAAGKLACYTQSNMVW